MSRKGPTLTFSATPARGKAHTVTVQNAETILFSDDLHLSKAAEREAFCKALRKKAPSLKAANIDAKLLELIADSAKPPSTPDPSEDEELEAGSIVRAEQFHRPEVSGFTVPIVSMRGGQPMGRLVLMLRWHTDGRRE